MDSNSVPLLLSMLHATHFQPLERMQFELEVVGEQLYSLRYMILHKVLPIITTLNLSKECYLHPYD